MIPDHALSKAIRAYDANTGFPAVFPLALEAAIETVAADIWDEGLEAGYRNAEAARPYDEMWTDEEPELVENPYRASED